MRDRYGPPEVVEVRDVDTPVPEADQVLVRVEAAAVNRADLDGLYPRWAFTRLFMGPRTPRQKSVGLDVAGTVEAVGPGVTRFKPGDRVFGDMFAFGVGAFAEYVCAPERAFEITPEGLSFEEAATLPHSAILAIQGLRLRDGRTIKAGDHVLIDGASGNVGPFAVQVAKARGAEVTAVASPAKLDFVRSLGADHAIDYTTTDYTKDRRALRLDRRCVRRALHARRASRAAAARRPCDARRSDVAHPRVAGSWACRSSWRAASGRAC